MKTKLRFSAKQNTSALHTWQRAKPGLAWIVCLCFGLLRTNTGFGMDMTNAQGGTAPADARTADAWTDKTLSASPAPDVPALRLGDSELHGFLRVDRLERFVDSNAHDRGNSYDLSAGIGSTYHKLLVKAEGEQADGRLTDARTEALYSAAVHPYWDAQLGLRSDTGEGEQRTWLAVGVQGLAPYWFEVDAAVYAGEGGRSAARLTASYDLLLTQQWVLQPQVEANAYGKADAARGLGSGLSTAVVGLRLRYDLRRDIGLYAGVEQRMLAGQTADLAVDNGAQRKSTHWLAGVRFWL